MKRTIVGLALLFALLLPAHAQEVPAPELRPVCSLYILNASSYSVEGQWYVPEYETFGHIPAIAPGTHQDMVGPCPVGLIGIHLISTDPRKTEGEQFIIDFSLTAEHTHQFILILDPQRGTGAQTDEGAHNRLLPRTVHDTD